MTAPRPDPTTSTNQIRSVASCRCHAGVVAGPCPQCGGRAIGWRARPGIARTWHAPDRPHWRCSDCNAVGWSLAELRRAAA
jgi:hypothetical protein